MKFMVILLLIVAIVILIGLFIMSARLLKHAQKQASTHESDANQSDQK